MMDNSYTSWQSHRCMTILQVLLLLLVVRKYEDIFCHSFSIPPTSTFATPTSTLRTSAIGWNAAQMQTVSNNRQCHDYGAHNNNHKEYSAPSSLSRSEPSSITTISTSRRNVLSSILAAISSTAILTSNPEPSRAGEIGARINRAVTQSDLGISVRRSVVRGAQVMDKLDGRWEQFSDENGLGAERSRRDARPLPRNLPDPLPLNRDIGLSILKASNEVFLSLVPVTDLELQSEIDRVDGLVRKSFERSGTLFSVEENGNGSSNKNHSKSGNGPTIAIAMATAKTMTASEFNYYCYLHFKSYCDILVEKKVPFNSFRKKFEGALGDAILMILDPNEASNETFPFTTTQQQQASKITPDQLKQRLEQVLIHVDHICTNLRSAGLVSLAERNPSLDDRNDDKVTDWAEDLSDLQFSIPLDGDVTLNSQILLQEQGFRLYPNFGKFVLASVMKRGLEGTGQEVSLDEYYMDTNYNSDPDLFEVKQVLLNVVIESI